MTTHGDSIGSPGAALHELAIASASLLGNQDVIGTTNALLAGCARATGACAAGLVVARPDDRQLELLSSTSHSAQELELYQLQVAQGPCVDAVRMMRPVTAIGSGQIAARWPTVTAAFGRAGYQAVYAVPMIWRGQALGAVNLFFADDVSVDEIFDVAQVFADMATVALVHSGRVTAQDVIARSRAALDERIVVERAKGVLAYIEDVSPEEAFDLLLALTRDAGQPLGDVATEIVYNAMNLD